MFTETDELDSSLSPPAKKQRTSDTISVKPLPNEPPSSAGASKNTDEDKCINFLLTTARDISPEFNQRKMAIGIKGIQLIIQLKEFGKSLKC